MENDSGESEGHILAVVSNNMEVTCPTPIAIIPGHVLRRPAADELEKVRQAIRSYGGPLDMNLRYESTVTLKDDATYFRATPDESKWRYWVIDVLVTRESPDRLHEISEAARLSAVELRCQTFFHGDGVAHQGWAGQGLGTGEIFPSVEMCDLATIEQIRTVMEGIAGIAKKFPSIRNAVARYYQLSAISRTQLLYLLGMFAVIESVLTHNPHGDYDSLGHQIKTKMKLLNERFDPPLDYSAFGKVNFDKLWSLMYSLRSRIAHGGHVDFDKELKLLGNSVVAREFLDNAAKTLLRHALKEPRLITDLQAC